MLLKRQKTIVAEAAEGYVEAEVTSEASFYKNIENVYGLLTVEQIEMEGTGSLIPLADESNGGNFIDRVVMFRKQMALDMGFVIPSVRIKDSGQLNPNQYSILLKGEEVARGDILMDHYLALPREGMRMTFRASTLLTPHFTFRPNGSAKIRRFRRNWRAIR